MARLVAIAGFFVAISSIASAQPMGKTKEYRSLNTDLYKISIQKNGQLDVTLATDVPVIVDAFPMVWIDGESEPERLKTSGKWAERLAVQDKLGQGQGVVHQHEGWEWSLRAYPTRPYFAVQLAYTNQGKKPVRIRALMPWCVGEPGKGMVQLGTGTNDARVLVNTTLGTPTSAAGGAESRDAIAVFNPTNGQSLIAGFLTQDHAPGLIEITRPKAEEKKNSSGFAHFSAISTFDPPVELAPGETIQSEVLYLGIAEADPVVGLQRYARAVQVVNGFGGVERDTPLHAWVVDPNAIASPAELLERLRSAVARIPAHTMGHVLIGTPGQPATAQIPESATQLAKAIGAAGLQPALWYDPFAAPNPTPQSIRQRGAQVRTAGFSVVAGVSLPNSTADARALVAAFREGIGPEARLLGVEPSLLAGTLFDGVVSRASDLRFLAPQPTRHVVWIDSLDAASLRTQAEVITAMLLGCRLLISLPDEIDDARRTLLTRILPAPTSWAHAVDLFTDNPGQVLHLKKTLVDGDLHIVTVCNWTDTTATAATLPLARIGLQAGTYYSVYNFGSQQYLGTAADTLHGDVPAGSAMVLVLRPVLTHPMLAAAGINLGQDFPPLAHVDWDAPARKLRVEIGDGGIAVEVPRYTLYVPAPYKVVSVSTLRGETIPWEASGASVSFRLPEQISAGDGFVANFSISN